jgi:hypothetical protein
MLIQMSFIIKCWLYLSYVYPILSFFLNGIELFLKKAPFELRFNKIVLIGQVRVQSY